MDGETVIERTEAEAADPADRSLLDDLRLLAGEARTLAGAEFAYQKTRAQVFGGGLGKIAALAAGTLLLASLALVGLVVGLILALTPVLGPWGATAVVVALLVVLSAICALWAKRVWHRLTDLVA